MNAGVPGSAATRPSTKLKIVVSLPDETAKQAAHGPAHVPRTASAAHASRQTAALGNPVIVGRSLPEPRDNNGRSELSKMRHDLFGEDFHVVDLAVEVAGFRAEPDPGGSQFCEFANALDPVVDVAGEGEPLKPVFGQPKLGHSLRVTPGLEHVVVQLVALDVFGNLGPELGGHVLAVET